MIEIMKKILEFIFRKQKKSHQLTSTYHTNQTSFNINQHHKSKNLPIDKISNNETIAIPQYYSRNYPTYFDDDIDITNYSDK